MDDLTLLSPGLKAMITGKFRECTADTFNILLPQENSKIQPSALAPRPLEIQPATIVAEIHLAILACCVVRYVRHGGTCEASLYQICCRPRHLADEASPEKGMMVAWTFSDEERYRKKTAFMALNAYSENGRLTALTPR
jgi:hypothetical protein